MPDSRAAMRGSMPEGANHRAFTRQRHRAASCDIRRNLPHFGDRSTRFVIRAEPHLIPPPFFDMGEDTGGGCSSIFFAIGADARPYRRACAERRVPQRWALRSSAPNWESLNRNQFAASPSRPLPPDAPNAAASVSYL